MASTSSFSYSILARISFWIIRQKRQSVIFLSLDQKIMNAAKAGFLAKHAHQLKKPGAHGFPSQRKTKGVNQILGKARLPKGGKAGQIIGLWKFFDVLGVDPF